MADVPLITHHGAAKLLAERDPVMARLVEGVGMPAFRRPMDTHFAALARSVLYQQLAGSAAAAIHARFIAVLDGEVTPEATLSVPFETLRSVGLSNNKALSICDLADKVVSGAVDLAPRRIGRLSDDDILEMLSSVRGIGRWTSQMFLMFQLRRMDIWPAGDLGVRRGFGLAWSIAMPKERDLEPLGEPFAPYRSIVAWYCWRACELYAGKVIVV